MAISIIFPGSHGSLFHPGTSGNFWERPWRTRSRFEASCWKSSSSKWCFRLGFSVSRDPPSFEQTSLTPTGDFTKTLAKLGTECCEYISVYICIKLIEGLEYWHVSLRQCKSHVAAVNAGFNMFNKIIRVLLLYWKANFPIALWESRKCVMWLSLWSIQKRISLVAKLIVSPWYTTPKWHRFDVENPWFSKPFGKWSTTGGFSTSNNVRLRRCSYPSFLGHSLAGFYVPGRQVGSFPKATLSEALIRRIEVKLPYSKYPWKLFINHSMVNLW